MTEPRDRSEKPGPVQEGLQAILNGAPTVRIGRNDRLVISSDLHLGNGGGRDDFRPNADLYRTVLQDHYLRRGFTLILNGDIEELLRFTLKAVRQRWAELFDLFAEFAGGAGLYKIFGNHDLELSLLDDPFPADRLLEGLRLSYQGETLLVFHGHQASPLAEKLHALTGIVLRYLANPLGIGNYTASRSSRKRFRVERRVYAFAIREKIISIIGHTHRPLFESLSKIDFLKFRIEGLCREYPEADAARREQLAGEIRLAREELESLYGKKNVDADRGSLYGPRLLVPGLFNAGTAIGKRGITTIEIEEERISLVHWFDRRRSRRNVIRETGEPERLGESEYYRVVLKQDLLEYIFTRIRLLT